MSRTGVHYNECPRKYFWVSVLAPIHALDNVMDQPEVPPPQPQKPADRTRRRLAPPPTMILQIDLNGIIQFANELFELVMGWRHGELNGLKAVAVLRPNDVIRDIEPENWQAYDEVRNYANPRDYAEFETHLDHRDGHAVRVFIKAKLLRQHHFVQIEMQVRSREAVLDDHRPQFAHPLERMAFEDFLEGQRQQRLQELEKKVDGFEQYLGETRGRARPQKHPGHRPLNPRLDTFEKFKAELEAAIKGVHDAWHPTRREVCERLGAKSENSLKGWLLCYGMLRHNSVARTLSEIAEELGLRGDSFLDD